MQQMWVGKRAEAQAARDHAEAAGEDTTEDDALIADLDEEITRSGVHGKALPDRPKRRSRSTRRRQDTPDLPKRPVSARTVGRTYEARDGKVFRPSMFLTLTCPSYGRISEDGTPADPGSYHYTQAAQDALLFAALFDRFIQNLRRYVGYDVQYFAAIEPQRRLAPTCIWPSAAPSPAPNCAPSWPPPTTRCGGPPPTWCASTAASSRSGTSRPAATLTRPPGSCCPPGTRPSTRSAPTTIPGTSPASGLSLMPRACSLGPETHRGALGI
jgi:hypothetical protein